MKLALPSEYCFFFPRPFAPGPPPGHWPVPPYPSPTPSGPEPGAGPRPPAAAPCPGSGRWGSPTAALGMLRGGRGGRFASQALALGGGRARGCSWSSSARSWSCREFPPPPLPLGARQREPAREPRAAASQRQGPPSLVPSPEPRAPRGAAPGEEPRRLGRVPRTGTARAPAGLHGRAGAWGAGRARQRPGRGCWGAGGCGCSSRVGRGARRLVRGGRGRDPAAGPEE